MGIVLEFGQLILGFAILILGGESLVKSAVSLAIRFKVTPAVIGLTIIAAGTSAPELVTSIVAVFDNKPDIALGNVIGSNIFNILAILGVATLLKTNRVESWSVKFDIPALVLFSIALIGFSFNLRLERYEGILFLAFFAAFLTASVVLARRQSHLVGTGEPAAKLGHPFMDVVYLVVGVGALIGGAEVALNAGVEIGRFFGLSERIIGVTIISVGTGLPELATSAVAAFRGHSDIAISNVVGSNIMNTLAVVGAAATLSPFAVSPQFLASDYWWMLSATIGLALVIYLGKMSLGPKAGVVFLLSYVAYLASLVFV